MRLGLSLGYQTAWSTPADHLALAQEADRLGFSVVWAAEAYGSDAPSMLAWIAGQTSHIDLGSAIMQIPARTPAMTAMTAATHRLTLRGSVPPRPWRLRTAGLRGLARCALRQTPDPHPGVRGHRAGGNGAQDRLLRRRVLHAAAAGRPGQGPEVGLPPGSR